jgi:putative membrane protein
MTTAPLLLNYLAFLGAGLGLWAASLLAYLWVTPMRELTLVREGNVAASLSLSGAALGLALPLGSLAVHAVGLADMALWGVLSLTLQVVFYVVAGRWSRAVAQMIAADNRAVGVLAGTMAICLGVISACCLTY